MNVRELLRLALAIEPEIGFVSHVESLIYRNHARVQAGTHQVVDRLSENGWVDRDGWRETRSGHAYIAMSVDEAGMRARVRVSEGPWPGSSIIEPATEQEHPR